MTEKKIKTKQYQREIDKYFGSMSGEIGSREKINSTLKKDRTPRPDRDPFYHYQTLKDVLSGKRVYFDSGVFAFLLEGFNSKSLIDIKDLILKDEIEVFTCEQVYSDIMSVCNSDKEDDAVNFVRTFNPSETDFRKLRKKGFKRFGNKSPARATHVLSAIDNKCDIFLTDDSEIRVPDDIELVFFSDYKDSLEQIPAI